ncbi:hypothetical protein ACVWZK_004125 [Bradyrhizobium sp. GM0.4]
MSLSSCISRSAAEQGTVAGRLGKGSRIVVTPSAGPRLAGKHGLVVGNGATVNQVRVQLDNSKHCITLHMRFLGPEANLRLTRRSLIRNRSRPPNNPFRGLLLRAGRIWRAC